MITTIGVIGAGYLGATHAACLAELGHHVVAADRDPARVTSLSAGLLPFFEPELPDLLRRHTESGRLRFTTSISDVCAAADVHFICVGTPQSKDGMAADTSQVFGVVEQMAPHLRRNALLVGKSTVPVGTAARLQELLDRLAPHAHAEVAWNPEFLREGQAVTDTLAPDRLVFGVASTEAEKTLRLVFDRVLERDTPLVVTDLATAELVKASANAFLATKISFANAIADLCQTAGGDVVTLADALGHDRRIGRDFLSAGLGFGGGCLPKDIRALMAQAAELGAEHAFRLLGEVDTINQSRRHRVTAMALADLGGDVSDARITVLGAAFKPHTDDVRDSPALEVADMLQRLGGEVTVHDPQGNRNASRSYPALAFADDVHDAVVGADLLLHLTEWPEFRRLDPRSLTPMVRRASVIDGRNALDADRWRQAGWSYQRLG